MLFWVSYMHVFCIFVFALVQHNWAYFTWKGTQEIRSLLLLLLSSLLSLSVFLTCHLDIDGVPYCERRPRGVLPVDLNGVVTTVLYGHVTNGQCPVRPVLHSLGEGGQRNEETVRQYGDHLLGTAVEKPFHRCDSVLVGLAKGPRKRDVTSHACVHDVLKVLAKLKTVDSCITNLPCVG